MKFVVATHSQRSIALWLWLWHTLGIQERKQQNPNRFYSTSHHVIIISSSWGALGAAYREKLRRVFHSCGERARLPWPGGAVPVPWPGAWAAVAVLWTWRRWLGDGLDMIDELDDVEKWWESWHTIEENRCKIF